MEAVLRPLWLTPFLPFTTSSQLLGCDLDAGPGLIPGRECWGDLQGFGGALAAS